MSDAAASDSEAASIESESDLGSDAIDDIVDTETAAGTAPLSVEGLLDDLDRVTAERDSFLDDSRRIAADFANFRRQTEKRNSELIGLANARLVEQLLPTLDACEAALLHGSADVEPIQAALLAILEREGLTTLRPAGEAFDPAQHEAVVHEPADDETTEPIVVAVLRTGYALRGRVLRPALVTVRG